MGGKQLRFHVGGSLSHRGVSRVAHQDSQPATLRWDGGAGRHDQDHPAPRYHRRKGLVGIVGHHDSKLLAYPGDRRGCV